METLRRRLITIPAVFILLPVGIALAPLVLVVGSIRDVADKRTGQPTARLWLYAIAWLGLEWIAIASAGVLSLLSWLDSDRATRGYQSIQGWWANAHLWWARKLLNVHIDMQDPATMPAGTVVVASRHASPIDAILPAWLFPSILKRPVHYTLKRELIWMPSIDLFCHRLGNHFVIRGGNTHKEVAAIKQMLSGAKPRAALVIFPEGTYSTAPVREKVRKSLRNKGETELAELAEELRFLLPPKAAGFDAYIDSAPGAPVVFLGHHGLEGVAEISSLRHALPLTEPVTVRWWVVPRSEVPDEPSERHRWLHDQWRLLDHWVQSCHQGEESI